MFQRSPWLLVILLLLSSGCQMPEASKTVVSTPMPTQTSTPFIVQSFKLNPTSSPEPTTPPTTEPTATSTEEPIVESPSTATQVIPSLTATKEVRETKGTSETREIKPTPTEAPIQTRIKVGAKSDRKQELLSQMLVLALQQAGLETEEQIDYSEPLAMRGALEEGELDLYWESVTTGLTVIHDLSTDVLPESRNRWYPLLKGLDKSSPLMWLEPIELNEEEQVSLVVSESMSEQPKVYGVLVDLLTEIGPRLNDDTISQLNACIEFGADKQADSGDEKSVSEVASAFLFDESLDCLPSKIVVGSKQLTEHVWGGKILVLVLQAAGYDVVDSTNTGPTDVVRQASLDGEIDLYLEIISTALTIFHELPPETLPIELARAFGLAKKLDEKNDLVWLKPVEKVETTYTLMMQQDKAEDEGITTIEDLASFMNANSDPFTICVEEDFATRPDGLPGIEGFYGFKFKNSNVLRLSARENYAGLLQGDCDVAQGLTVVDVQPFGFRILEDTQNLFLPFTPAPVIRKDVLNEYPELEQLLAQVVDAIDGGAVAQLNALVEVGRDGVPNSGDEESPDTIARLVLCQVGLFSDCPTLLAVAAGDESQDEGEEEGVTENESINKNTNTNNPANEDTNEDANEDANEDTNENKQNISEKTNSTLATGEGICREIILNGQFERNSNWGFPATLSQASFTTERFHSGQSALRIGIFSPDDDRLSQSVAKQLISIPSNAEKVTLSYWYNPVSFDLGGNDTQGTLVLSANEALVMRKLQQELSDQQLWNQQTHDLSSFIGEKIVLYFYVDNDGNGQPSGMYLDDVSVEVCSGS